MSYRALPNVVSSGWVAQQIKNIGGTVAAVVNPGVNSFLWHNRYREKHDDRFTVAVMLLQNYPYKGANRGTEYCRQLTEVIKENNLNIKLMAIGIDALPTIPGVTCVGGLSLSKLADVLGNEVDLLVDPAILHSYGLPALEALVSGCHAITFENHGVHEYAKAWGDRIRVVETEEQAVAETLLFATRHQNGELDQLDRTISRQQVEEHSRARAIDKFIDSVFPAPTPVRSLHIEVVTPHLRKHGGPTTNIMLANSLIDIGHKVTMSMIHTDWNPEVLKMSKAKVRTKWQKMPSGCDVVIINSDNPYAEEIMTLNPGRKYIMYKLSHNARFKIEEQNTLNLPWDHIITSTQWLKDACLTLQPEWEHKVWSDDKVTVVGWYHYGHKVFECNPHNRNYGTIEAGFRAGTLIHQHPLKGSIDALASFTGLKKKYGNFFHAVGIGEVPKAKLPPWAQYLQSPNRVDMAHILRQVDIWLGASHTEGLGRMALEAMSAGTAVVTTDTGAEFLKHEENCLLYPINNPQAGAEAVDRLITDQKLMTRLVINAFDTACRAADPTRFKAQIEKIVMEVYDA
jgi:glycosyltransferase involved in cell wall biosynthesis